MEKPRIIIADTDPNYVIPLQMKFAEDLYEQVDLEIITDRDYFRQLFSKPQQADILIVSENLYFSDVRRHNISHVFLMMEQQEEPYTVELNINRLYKYTSIKEIFTEITGISADALDIRRESKRQPQIVAVCSACGGVGKTTIALGISVCLSRQYKRVLFIGADRLQSFQRMLENPSPISSSDVYSDLMLPSRDAYDAVRHVVRREGFSYLPPFRVPLLALGLQYSVYERIARCARDSGEYDYIVVDTDSTFDEDKARLMDVADKVVIVTRQTANAVYATNLLAANINGLNSDKYLFVCNDYNRNQENALVAPAQSLKFVPNEYIVHKHQYDHLKCADLAKDSDLQKTAVLIM